MSCTGPAVVDTSMCPDQNCLGGGPLPDTLPIPPPPAHAKLYLETDLFACPTLSPLRACVHLWQQVSAFVKVLPRRAALQEHGRIWWFVSPAVSGTCWLCGPCRRSYIFRNVRPFLFRGGFAPESLTLTTSPPSTFISWRRFCCSRLVLERHFSRPSKSTGTKK